MCLVVMTYTGKKGGKDGVLVEENILVTKDGYELLSLWPIDELMECWLPCEAQAKGLCVKAGSFEMVLVSTRRS